MQDNYIEANKQLVADFVEYISRELNYSKDTVRVWAYWLAMFGEYLGNTALEDLEIRQVSDYLRTRSELVMPESLNTERSALRSFFRYVVSYRRINLQFDYSLIRNAKVPRPDTHFISTAELRAMLAKLPNKQDRLVLITFFATGMRIGELVRLRVEDLQERAVRVRYAKGGEHRTIPISADLAFALQEHLYENNIAVGAVFRHQRPKSTLPSEAFTVSGLRKRLQRQLDKYGLKLRPHWLRHGAATELLTNGMGLRELMDFLGHKHIDTTQRYTHITDQRLREAVDKADHLREINLREVLR